MEGLLQQLGIDWKLFLSQAFNFFILLLIMKAFVYKPLLAVIKERNKRIREGLEKASEADVRLKEIDVIAKGRLQKADQESMHIIKNTEAKAKKLEESLTKKAEDRQKELLAEVQSGYERQQEQARQNVFKEASELVKKIIIKTVGLSPKDIDDALIEKAVSQISKE